MKSRVIASCWSHKIQAGLQGGSVTQSIQQHLLTLVGTMLRLVSQVPREQGPVTVHPGGPTTPLPSLQLLAQGREKQG